MKTANLTASQSLLNVAVEKIGLGLQDVTDFNRGSRVWARSEGHSFSIECTDNRGLCGNFRTSDFTRDQKEEITKTCDELNRTIDRTDPFEGMSPEEEENWRTF